MEIKLIKGAKSTEVVKVLSAESKAKMSEASKSLAKVDANGDLKLSKWSNKVFDHFGGLEKIVNRVKKAYPKLKISIVEASAPAPAPAPAPEPAPAPAPEPAPAPAPEPAPAPANG